MSFWSRTKWNVRETYAYSCDYVHQFYNWIRGTYILYFSEIFDWDRCDVKITGIDKVSIWVGSNFRDNSKRIYVGNLPNAR